MTTILITNDYMANYFAFECKGFEFLVERLTTPLEAEKMMIEAQAANPDLQKTKSIVAAKGILEKWKKTKSDLISEKNLVPVVDGAPQPPPLKKEKAKLLIPSESRPQFEEEFAAQMVMVPSPGQNQETHKDWQKNKKGLHRYISYSLLTGNYYYEYPLTFTLSKKADIKSLKIGFLNHWQDFGDKVVSEPSYVHVHYKRDASETSWQYLTTLDTMRDNGYNLAAVTVFEKNFYRANGNNCEDAIESLKSFVGVHQIRFLIGRPYISFMERYSQLATKQYENVCIAVSFISILGRDDSTINLCEQNELIRENFLLKIFSNIFTKNFNETYKRLALQNSFIEKMKISFNKILINYVDLFGPVLISFSQNNSELGAWIIFHLLNVSHKEIHAKLIGEILVSSPNEFQNRIQKLLEFIKKECAVIVAEKRQNLGALPNFMSVFSTCVHKSPIPASQAVEPLSLEIDYKTIDILTDLIDLFPHMVNLNKFVITLLNLPLALFKPSEDNLSEYIVEVLIEKMKAGHHKLAELLSFFVVTNPSHSKKVLDSGVIQNLPVALDQNSIPILLFLRNIASERNCLQYMIEKDYDILIFKMIKEKLTDLEKNTGILNLGLDIIKTIFVTSQDRIDKFCTLLIEDIDEDIKKKKPNPSYMKNLFQPIFSAEKNYRLCIHTDQLKINEPNCDEILKITEEEKPKRIESALLPEKFNTL